MKNLMFSIVSIFMIVVMLVATSCKDQNKINSYGVQTIDSCEYIVSAYDRSKTITHKGNCKYCKVRNAKVDTVYITK